MSDEDWTNPGTRTLGVQLNSRQERLLMLFNAHNEEIGFRLPRLGGHHWRLLVDTASGLCVPAAGEAHRERLAVSGHTLALLEAAP